MTRGNARYSRVFRVAFMPSSLASGPSLVRPDALMVAGCQVSARVNLAEVPSAAILRMTSHLIGGCVWETLRTDK